MDEVKKGRTKIDPGYLVVSLIVVLSIITICIAWRTFNNSQEISIVADTSPEVVTLPETGDSDEDARFECDEYSNGKKQTVDGVELICSDYNWVIDTSK